MSGEPGVVPGPSHTENHDEAHHFFMESHRIAIEAQFIIDSLPNTEITAVERIVRQLEAVRTILLCLDDPATTSDEIDQLAAYVNFLLIPLEDFLASPPLPANTHIPREYTDTRGRPSYILDLQRAQELHALGNTWKDIATAMGVVRQTLYNRMAANGLSTARREFTDISDEDLDELVAEISLQHPFIGSTIVHGHLEAREVRVPRLRVQESLKRVDAIGVLVRFVSQIYHTTYHACQGYMI